LRSCGVDVPGWGRAWVSAAASWRPEFGVPRSPVIASPLASPDARSRLLRLIKTPVRHYHASGLMRFNGLTSSAPDWPPQEGPRRRSCHAFLRQWRAKRRYSRPSQIFPDAIVIVVPAQDPGLKMDTDFRRRDRRPQRHPQSAPVAILASAYSACSTVATSPARVVRRTSRTSLRSKRRARCIVERLSHMTRS